MLSILGLVFVALIVVWLLVNLIMEPANFIDVFLIGATNGLVYGLVALGYTLVYLTLLVIVPLLTLPIRAASVPWDQLKATITDPRVVASYQLSIGASFIAACVNGVFGLIVAWVLVRYSFPGRRIIDSLVDLPFALPTAVAGITLTTLCAPNGWIGQYAEPYGIKLAFSRIGV